jgi:hypothetical protein
MESFLTFPARRDVAGLEDGDHVTVVLLTTRYGAIEVSGRVFGSPTGDLWLGGRLIAGPQTKAKDGSASRAPISELRTLVADPAGLHGEIADPLTFAHGDLVSVDVEQVPYGLFTVSGVATEGDDGHVRVGEWAVAGGGALAKRLRGARLVGRDHTEPVPSRREPLGADE